jgi:hypothetical protein
MPEENALGVAESAEIVSEKPKRKYQKKKISLPAEKPTLNPIDAKIQELKKLSKKIDFLKDVLKLAKNTKPDSEFPEIKAEVSEIIESFVNALIQKFENSIK